MRTRRARAVIGANYGDEGKGLATDAYAAETAGRDCAVIRFNGGAQAGHTVTAPDGRRHVFSHFGSGSLAGAATYLSEFFVLNTHEFGVERAELAALGVVPEVYADPDAQVSVPFDVMINRWAEETRGSARHGSVGIGFGETVERSLRGPALPLRHLGDERHVASLLDLIRNEWLPTRLAELRIEYTAERAAVAADADVLARFLVESAAMRSGLTAAGIDAVLDRPNLVFEGAQGLLLDQDRGHAFPYLTRSNTGLKNVLAIAQDAGIERLDVTYMTRAYLTRHGAGPLRNEVSALDFAEVVDPTNAPNVWQGTIRYAPLDLDVLREAIAADLSDTEGSNISIAAGLGVSCIDQIRGSGILVVGGEQQPLNASEMAIRIGDEVRLPVVLESRGPTRDRVMRPASRRLAA